MNGCWMAIRGGVRAVFLIGGWTIFLAASALLTQIGAARAFPAGQAATELRHGAHPASGLPLIAAGACRNDGRPCVEGDEPPYVEPRKRVSRWAPPPEHHEGPYENAPYEQDPVCAEQRHRPRGYVYNAPPPPRGDYDGYADEACGTRCWYQRLRAGYCGRGCDYYRFRLNEFPEGKLGPYRRRQLACRDGR